MAKQTFTYAYKTSDGIRHEASMEAVSREAVFESLRAQGIKAIKVVAADGSKANGEVRGVRKRVVTVVALAVALVAGVVAFGLGRARSMTSPRGDQVGNGGHAGRVTLPGAATSSRSPYQHIAQPLPRQMIPGDRQRIAAAVQSLTNAAERALAAFVEPGRPLPAPNAQRPADGEFAASLAMPLRIAAAEWTESIDLKRIVAGIKSEMRAYLAGGGTVAQYLAECVKRQKQEIAYRARAEEHLASLLKEGETATSSRSPYQRGHAGRVTLPGTPQSNNQTIEQSNNSQAYAYWLKANAQLQSMGIYPLPLPDQLRDYQLSLDIDE